MDTKVLKQQSFHIYYECWMLYEIARRFNGEDRRHPDGWPEQFTNNLLLESFAIHARALEDFLWSDGENEKKDDCFAWMYFGDPSDWKRLRGSDRPDIPRERVNKEIVHLTFKRYVDPSDKIWKPTSIYIQLFTAIDAFQKYVDSNTLDTLWSTSPIRALAGNEQVSEEEGALSSPAGRTHLDPPGAATGVYPPRDVGAGATSVDTSKFRWDGQSRGA